MTQFFFEVDEYMRLVDDLCSSGVDKPVLPGIMPVTSLSSIPRMARWGQPCPDGPSNGLEEAGRLGPEQVRKVGIDMATELCSRLLDAGAPGLHFYTSTARTRPADLQLARHRKHLAVLLHRRPRHDLCGPHRIGALPAGEPVIRTVDLTKVYGGTDFRRSTD